MIPIHYYSRLGVLDLGESHIFGGFETWVNFHKESFFPLGYSSVLV